MATRKKTTKKATRKKAAPKAASRKRASKATAKQKARGGAAQKLSPTEALARKIVRLANQPDKLDLTEIYAEACVSREPQGAPASGIDGLREKNAFWESIVQSQNWTAKSSFVKGNRICIEWHCDLKLKDGRELAFEEVALHDVRGGKIVAERYYYDPSVLAPPAEAEAAPAPEEEATQVLPAASADEAPGLAADLADPAPPPEEKVEPGTPPLDPLDL
jgi:hypothetical protein